MVCIGVLYLSGDGWYACRVGAQSTSEPKVQDRPKPSRGCTRHTTAHDMDPPVAEVNTKVQGAEDTYISQATFLMTELLAIMGSGPFRIRTPDKPQQVDPVPYDDVETFDLCVR